MQFVTIMSGFLLFAFQFVMFSGHLLLLRINAQLLSINLQVNTRYSLRAFPELPMIIKLRNGREKHENVKGVFMTNSLIAFNYSNMDHRLKGKESKRDTLLEKSEYLNEALHI